MRTAVSWCVPARVEEPTGLEHFLTARWGMHNAFFGGAASLPNHHPRRGAAVTVRPGGGR